MSESDASAMKAHIRNAEHTRTRPLIEIWALAVRDILDVSISMLNYESLQVNSFHEWFEGSYFKWRFTEQCQNSDLRVQIILETNYIKTFFEIRGSISCQDFRVTICINLYNCAWVDVFRWSAFLILLMLIAYSIIHEQMLLNMRKSSYGTSFSS